MQAPTMDLFVSMCWILAILKLATIR